MCSGAVSILFGCFCSFFFEFLQTHSGIGLFHVSSKCATSTKTAHVLDHNNSIRETNTVKAVEECYYFARYQNSNSFLLNDL